MTAVVELLVSTPLLTLAIVIGLGTLVGMIPFGPVRFGPAGALFVGLAVGALDPRLGEPHALVQTLGLALFVYTVGLASGAAFFRGLRRQLPLMLVSVGVLVVGAAVTIGLGMALGLGSPFGGGAFAGSLTSTPALAAATVAAGGSKDPAVAYALAYPVGVLVTIILVSMVLERRWPATKDPAPAASAGLIDLSVEVERPSTLREVPGYDDHDVRFSFLSRDRDVRVVTTDEEELRPGDRVVVIGPEPAVRAAVEHLGRRVSHHLAHDRAQVDYRRIVLSNPKLAGRRIGELDLPGRFEGIVTRVRRGDLDLLAHDDLVVELGDRLRVVVPREQMPKIAAYLGDSDRKVSEVDALSLGVGLTLGLLVGKLALSLPGGAVLSLGTAAGPLVVGMILGRLERTGRVVWGLPTAANLTIRQIGLLLFLAAVGLASGHAFAAAAPTLLGLKIVVVAAVNVLITGLLMLFFARRLGQSQQRSAGALAGFVGQPAILAFANGKVVDERVDAGYATLFALDIVVKIVLVQVIVLL